jgi:hypothetical protein
MPAAPRPGDRLRMEAALGTELVEALHAQCRSYPIPLDRWHRVPLLARAWEVTAVTRLADRLRAEEGIGAKTALDTAAIRLGLEPDTVISRIKRSHAAAYRRAA